MAESKIEWEPSLNGKTNTFGTEESDRKILAEMGAFMGDVKKSEKENPNESIILRDCPENDENSKEIGQDFKLEIQERNLEIQEPMLKEKRKENI